LLLLPPPLLIIHAPEALALGPVETHAVQTFPALRPEVGGGDLGPLGLLPVHLALPVHPVAKGVRPLGLVLHPEESRDVERPVGGEVVEEVVEVIVPCLSLRVRR